MANEEFGAYSPATAKMIFDVVKYLKASGLVPTDGKRGGMKNPLPLPTHFRNDSGSTIPAYGIMHVTGSVEAFGKTYHTVNSYAHGNFGGFLFNSKREVEDGDTGNAQTGIHFIAAGDGSADTLGRLWGPSPGSFLLTPNGGPYIMTGDSAVVSNAVRVQLDVAATYRAIVTTQISARVGSTEGSGVVSLKTVGASNATATLQTGVSVTSLLSEVIDEDAEVIVARTTNGRLQVIAEDCG